jgi:hypothetical protein
MSSPRYFAIAAVVLAAISGFSSLSDLVGQQVAAWIALAAAVAAATSAFLQTKRHLRRAPNRGRRLARAGRRYQRPRCHGRHCSTGYARLGVLGIPHLRRYVSCEIWNPQEGANRKWTRQNLIGPISWPTDSPTSRSRSFCTYPARAGSFECFPWSGWWAILGSNQ